MKYLWVFDPDSVAVVPFITAPLFALGGGGQKLLRRFALPLFVFLSAWSMDKNVWLSLLAGLGLIIPLSKGYGDSMKEHLTEAYYYPFLYVLGFFFGLALMPLASKLWHVFLCLIPAVTFGGLSFSSQKADFPRWKWVEAWTGFSIGFVLLALIS